MNVTAIVVLVVGVIVAFLFWLNWWLPQMQAAVGR